MSTPAESPNPAAPAATAGDAASADAPSFGQALEELETILRRIDEDDIDVDRLAEELRRATELLELCRGKIRKAELEVEQIVATLDA